MTADVERVELAPGYSIARIINGCWQLSPDHGGGPASRDETLRQFSELVEHGCTTFDCADIYEGTEALLGQFRRSLAKPDVVQIHTKYVPDRNSLHALQPADVDLAIERSLRRLDVERIDLVQFHWWSYDVPGIDAVMAQLVRAQAAGKIRLIGVTNFDTPHLRQMMESGAPIVAMQTQYSLLDRRPETSLVDYVATRGVHLLAYGTLGGGFLSERWLGEQQPREMNRSLQKYRLIIDEVAGWEQFQNLLAVLHSIARKHDVAIATVAARWALDRPSVAAAILGIGRKSRVAQYAEIAALSLHADDERAINEQLKAQAIPPGDTYELERNPDGLHAKIIKTDLRTETGG